MARRAVAPEPSERRSTEWAHERLRRAIISGALRPGTVISQSGVAVDLGVSRTPLREAIRRLQQEGLLVGEPNRRLRVAEASPEDLDQLYAMRIATESLALGIAVPRMTASDVSRLAAALEEMESHALDGRLELTERPHREFHRLLVSPAGERFERQAAVLWDHTARYRSIYLSTGGSDLPTLLAKARREHRSILEAVSRGEGALAGARLAGHYASTARSVLEVVDSESRAEATEAALQAANARVT